MNPALINDTSVELGRWIFSFFFIKIQIQAQFRADCWSKTWSCFQSLRSFPYVAPRRIRPWQNVSVHESTRHNRISALKHWKAALTEPPCATWHTLALSRLLFSVLENNLFDRHVSPCNSFWTEESLSFQLFWTYCWLDVLLCSLFI